jgi:hypothetical protein
MMRDFCAIPVRWSIIWKITFNWKPRNRVDVASRCCFIFYKNIILKKLLTFKYMLPHNTSRTISGVIVHPKLTISDECHVDNHRLFTVSRTAPPPTKLIIFKSLKVRYMFRPVWPSSGVRNVSSNEETAAFCCCCQYVCSKGGAQHTNSNTHAHWRDLHMH